MLLRQVDKKSAIHRYTALRAKPNSKNNLIFTPDPLCLACLLLRSASASPTAVQGPGFSWLFQPPPRLSLTLAFSLPLLPRGSFPPKRENDCPSHSSLSCPPDWAPAVQSPQQCEWPHALGIPVPGATLFTALRAPLKTLVSALEESTPSERLQDGGWSTRWGWCAQLCSPTLAPSLQASPLPAECVCWAWVTGRKERI